MFFKKVHNIYALKKNEKGIMRYSKNTSWVLGEKILRIVCGLFVGIWVTRYLGPEQFGLYAYAISFVGIFSAISILGLDTIVVRELVKDETRSDELLGTSFILKFLGALGMLIVLSIAVNFTSNNSQTNNLVFIIASATFFHSFNVVDMYFQSKVLSKYVVYANVISLLMSSIIKIVLILNEAPLIAFAWVVLFDSFVLASGFVYFYIINSQRHNKSSILHLLLNAKSSFVWKFNKSTSLSLLKDSLPLAISHFAISIYMKVDQVILKDLMNAEAVGQYAAAIRLSEAWYFVPMAIAASLFPAIINAKKQNKELYNVRLQRLYCFMVWLGIFIALPMTFLSDWVIHFLYGEQYSQSASVLMIHIWAGVFVFWGVASSRWLISENLQVFLTINTCIGAILNILLNYILIPKIGIAGAAWATLISYFVASYLCLLFFKKTRINFINLTKSIFFVGVLGVEKKT